jgi:hypothetical protein
MKRKQRQSDWKPGLVSSGYKKNYDKIHWNDHQEVLEELLERRRELEGEEPKEELPLGSWIPRKGFEATIEGTSGRYRLRRKDG